MKQVESDIIFSKMEEQGREVIGAVRINCPIYSLQVRLKRRKVDISYPIDRAILKYIELCRNCEFDPKLLIALIGIGADTFQWRYNELVERKFISKDENDRLMVTDTGRLYLENERETPWIVEYRDIPVDGVTLNFLDDIFYQTNGRKVKFHSKCAEDIIYHELATEEDEPLQNICNVLEQMSSKEKNKLGIDPSAQEFSIMSFERQTVNNVFLVYSYDISNNQYKRDLLFHGRIIKFDAISNISDYYFYLFHSDKLKRCAIYNSYGYLKKENMPFSNFCDKDIQDFIQHEFDINDIPAIKDKYIHSESGFPLTIIVDQELYNASSKKPELLKFASKGFSLESLQKQHEKESKDINKYGFLVIKYKNEIPQLTELYDYVQSKPNELDVPKMNRLIDEGQDLRRILLEMEAFDSLEQLDIQTFFTIH